MLVKLLFQYYILMYFFKYKYVNNPCNDKPTSRTTLKQDKRTYLCLNIIYCLWFLSKNKQPLVLYYYSGLKSWQQDRRLKWCHHHPNLRHTNAPSSHLCSWITCQSRLVPVYTFWMDIISSWVYYLVLSMMMMLIWAFSSLKSWVVKMTHLIQHICLACLLSLLW